MQLKKKVGVVATSTSRSASKQRPISKIKENIRNVSSSNSARKTGGSNFSNTKAKV